MLVAETSVSFAFFCSSGIVSAPQLHMVERTFDSDSATLSFSAPAYGTYESTPSSNDSFLSPPKSYLC